MQRPTKVGFRPKISSFFNSVQFPVDLRGSGFLSWVDLFLQSTFIDQLLSFPQLTGCCKALCEVLRTKA